MRQLCGWRCVGLNEIFRDMWKWNTGNSLVSGASSVSHQDDNSHLVILQQLDKPEQS